MNVDVDKRRQLLHVDDVKEFVSRVEQFQGRPLHFRKLRYGEVMLVQGMMPDLPWPAEPSNDATDEQLNEYDKQCEAFWKQVSNEDKMRSHEAMSTALAAATKDEYAIQDIRDLEPPLVAEIFKWLMDFSGYSDKAVDDLTWFRRHGRRPA